MVVTRFITVIVFGSIPSRGYYILDVIAQDAFVLKFLMFVGVLFSAAALWLLLKPRSNSGTAKIELFGLKFESSSAGVIVFLIGTMFLVAPLFVPERESKDLSDRGSVEKISAPTIPPNSSAENPGSRAVLLPPGPESQEIEPNNELRKANQINFNNVVLGETSGSDPDWYVVAITEPAPKKIEVRLHKREGHCTKVTVFDSKERKNGLDAGAHTCDGSVYVTARTNGHDKFYLRIHSPGSGFTEYEIGVTALN